MALKTFVRISNVNNLSDARYCAGMEVNQIGFNIVPENENYTDPVKFKEISNWLSGVEFVGEIDSDSVIDIDKLVENYQLDALQVTTIDQVEKAKLVGIPIIFKVDMTMLTEALLESLKDDVSYFLVDSLQTGEISSDLLKLASTYPLVMSFGFTTATVDHIITTTSIKGIAMKGGLEERPGFKNFDELADILETLEIDDTV